MEIEFQYKTTETKIVFPLELKIFEKEQFLSCASILIDSCNNFENLPLSCSIKNSEFKIIFKGKFLYSIPENDSYWFIFSGEIKYQNYKDLDKKNELFYFNPMEKNCELISIFPNEDERSVIRKMNSKDIIEINLQKNFIPSKVYEIDAQNSQFIHSKIEDVKVKIEEEFDEEISDENIKNQIQEQVDKINKSKNLDISIVHDKPYISPADQITVTSFINKTKRIEFTLHFGKKIFYERKICNYYGILPEDRIYNQFLEKSNKTPMEFKTIFEIKNNPEIIIEKMINRHHNSKKINFKCFINTDIKPGYFLSIPFETETLKKEIIGRVTLVEHLWSANNQITYVELDEFKEKINLSESELVYDRKRLNILNTTVKEKKQIEIKILDNIEEAIFAEFLIRYKKTQ